MTGSAYDLVGIGMGAAGLTAALASSNARPDARVAVLERAPESERGGATRSTSSWFPVGEDRSLDPRFPELMVQFSGGLADQEYWRTLATEAQSSIAFLEEHEVEYIFFRQGLPNRNTGGGLGMPADHGRVDGVLARGPDRLLRKLVSPAVVIASGGFEGNAELLTQCLGDRPCDLPAIAPGPGNKRGEGIRMAVEVGADGLQRPKCNWAFPLERPPFFGYPLSCAITFTFDGVHTDTNAHVVTPAGRPTPGLYAAGEVTGQYYSEYPVGTSVLRAITSGRLAGARAGQAMRDTGAIPA